MTSKEIVHAVTSLDGDQATAADLAKLARGQWGIESLHWLRDTAYAEDANTGDAGNGPQAITKDKGILPLQGHPSADEAFAACVLPFRVESVSRGGDHRHPEVKLLSVTAFVKFFNSRKP